LRRGHGRADRKRRGVAGGTITDFALTSVQDAARRAIEEHQRLELSDDDTRASVEALLNPTPVNDRLRQTVHRYREATGVKP
jgi:uncharacterized protein (DUF1778 family)